MAYDKNSSSYNNLIIVLGLFFHVILLCAVCEIHYPSSAIERSINLTEPTTDSPDAKRLVLFLADGLRAESILGFNSYRVPFLSNIMLTTGSWGIAHSRALTLEKSGHMAILSGTYENILNTIYKSWTLQPTNIDSLLNQSSNSWCWGDIDAVRIFNADNLPHIHVFTYPPNGNESYNKWILGEIKKIGENIYNRNKTKGKIYEENRSLFLVHLPVKMMADYPMKPTSRKFKEYIVELDKQVEAITMLFKQMFDDAMTSYVFTSAHGITDWGSHGGDSQYETEMPFIAWGAGVRSSLRQIDLKQIDIAPLMAALIGVSVPKNSLGIIPMDYLSMSEDFLVSDLAVNALQLSKIFLEKMERVKSTVFQFSPYKDLDKVKIDNTFIDLQMLYIKTEYRLLLRECQQFIKELIKGINYYQTYDQLLIFSCVSFALFEWILLVSLYATGRNLFKKRRSLENVLIFFSIYIPVYFCFIRKFSLLYYLYVSVPFILFVALYPHVGYLVSKVLFPTQWTIYFMLCLLSIQLFVFAFFSKIIISCLLLLIGLSVTIQNSYRKLISYQEKVIWLSLCLTLASFSSISRPLKPVFSFPLFIYSTLIWIYLFYKWEKSLNRSKYLNIFWIQKSCLMIGAIYKTILDLGYDNYFPPIKYLFWLLSIIPFILIPLSNTFISFRLAANIFGVVPFYLLTSSGDELLFLVVFVATLLQLFENETKSFCVCNNIIPPDTKFEINYKKTDINENVIRIVFFQFVFLLVGFCKIGNATNIYPYNPVWIKLFLPTSDPIITTILIFFKMIVPIFICGCLFRAINSLTKLNDFQIFCWVLFICDVVLFQLLFFIDNMASKFRVTILQFLVINSFVIAILFVNCIISKITQFSYFNTTQKLSIKI